MQSLFINILLIALILIPMIYFMLGNKRSSEQIKSFKNKAGEQNLSLSEICSLSHVILGVDNTSKILCWQISKGSDLYSIAFSELLDVTVSKSYQMHMVHGAETGTLSSVAVLLHKKDKKDIAIPVFNEADGHPIGNDLLDVTEFVNKIKKSHFSA
jgi:hypothetical protein